MEADVNWYGVLEHHARRTPTKPITIEGDLTVTYQEMVERTTALAAGLAERGVERGDVVGLLAYNCTEFIETIFAANYLGAVVMPVNWRLAAAEVRYILEHSEAKAFVCGDGLVELGSAATEGLDDAVLRVAIRTSDAPGWLPFDELRSGNTPPERAKVAAEELHRLMYTSGTTGRPKGVMITHANLAWKNFAHIVEFGVTNDELGLACGPLYHVGALDLTTTTLLAAGATMILHRTFDAAAVVAEIERSRVSAIWMAPAMVNAILALDDVESHDLSSVRFIIAGGEKMPVPLIERILRTFPNAWFADAYGLTETVSGDTFLDKESVIAKLGSAGRACLYTEVQIWDEDGHAVAPGERGEIVIRGPKVFKGYWRDPEATAKAFEGGWFHSGDVGILDEDGYIFIVDRLKDMIISGGENIASSEVERVLYEHDAVLEVAVVGRSHERWGEVPIAFVVLRPGTEASAEELIEHSRGQLAKYKVPTDIIYLDELPRNPSGKVLKRELRDPV
jgi:acyl-CoA synthetase (AMP-forming)/AMP-acid ligase II